MFIAGGLLFGAVLGPFVAAIEFATVAFTWAFSASRIGLNPRKAHSGWFGRHLSVLNEVARWWAGIVVWISLPPASLDRFGGSNVALLHR